MNQRLQKTFWLLRGDDAAVSDPMLLLKLTLLQNYTLPKGYAATEKVNPSILGDDRGTGNFGAGNQNVRGITFEVFVTVREIQS